MRKSLLPAVVTSMVLVACGGGGDSGLAVSPAAAPDVANAFDAVLGTYKSGCVAREYNSDNSSQDTTVVVSAPKGADKAKIVATQKFYGGSVNCTGTLQEAFVATGQITAAAATKTITSGAKTGVVNTAEVKYESLTFLAGSFTLPALGTTAKVGYSIEGGKLYGLSGKRDADGLPSTFSSIVLTKQ